jgi:hypothetical protein
VPADEAYVPGAHVAHVVQDVALAEVVNPFVQGAQTRSLLPVRGDTWNCPAPQSDSVLQARSLLSVGARLSYCALEQSVRSLHARLLVGVGAFDSYCEVGLQTVRAAHSRSPAVVSGFVSY